MTQNLDGTWSRTFEIPDGASFEWKYTRGNWETVENWGSISGLGNRGPIVTDYGADGMMTIDNTATDWGTGADSDKAVQNWRDPLVAGHTPTADAVDVPVGTTVVVEWSKAMGASTSFSVTGPGLDGAVAGSFALSNSDTSVTFTPSAPLEYSTTYNVVVSGQTAVGGDVQQVPVAYSFTTLAEAPPVLESITVTPLDPTLQKTQNLSFTATGHYDDGSSVDATSLVTWATSDKKVASVNPNGQVHAKNPGTAVISATLQGVVGQSTVTVIPKQR
jgi:hypothetical protein